LNDDERSGGDAVSDPLALLLRGGLVESVHRGSLVVADQDGQVIAALGDVSRRIYPRSALKPFQALASLSLLESGGVTLSRANTAIACASHQGDLAQQLQVQELLSTAGFDSTHLGCPDALPEDSAALVSQNGLPSKLAHNCSGKHAAFVLAQHAVGQDTNAYLDAGSVIQTEVREQLRRAARENPEGPAVDGCGAPAWRLSLRALAVAFARLSTGEEASALVRDSMVAHPALVGGARGVDSRLMAGDPRVVAKRGAEAVFAAGFISARGPVGIAVKVDDGGDRAAGPVVAELLTQMGAQVSERFLTPNTLASDRGFPEFRIADAVRTLI
jgi:L-asparaginase II